VKTKIGITILIMAIGECQAIATLSKVGNLNNFYKPVNEGSSYRKNLNFKQDDEADQILV
jgi:hypothetical protein